MDVLHRPNDPQAEPDFGRGPVPSSQVSPWTNPPLSTKEDFLPEPGEENSLVLLFRRVENSVTDTYLRRFYGDYLSGCRNKIFEPQYPTEVEKSESAPALPRDVELREQTLQQALNPTIVRWYDEVSRSGRLSRRQQQLQEKIDRALDRYDQVREDESLGLSYEGQGMLYRNLPDAAIEIHVNMLLNQAHSAIQRRQLDHAEDLVQKALSATWNLDYEPIDARCFAWLYVIRQLRQDTQGAAKAFLSALPCVGKYIEGRLLRVCFTPGWYEVVRQHTEVNELSAWSNFSKSEVISYLDAGLEGHLTRDEPLKMGTENDSSSDEPAELDYQPVNDNVLHSVETDFGARKTTKPPPLDLSGDRVHPGSQQPISSSMSTHFRQLYEEVQRPTSGTPDAEGLSEPSSATWARPTSSYAGSEPESDHDPSRHLMDAYLAKKLIEDSGPKHRRKRLTSDLRPKATEVEKREINKRHRASRHIRIKMMAARLESAGLDYSAIVDSVHQSELSELRDRAGEDIDDPYEEEYKSLMADAKKRNLKSHSPIESPASESNTSPASTLAKALRPPPLDTKAHHRRSEAELTLSDTPAVVSSETEDASNSTAIHLGGVRGGNVRKASIVDSPTLSSPSPLRETSTLEDIVSDLESWEGEQEWDSQAERMAGE